MKLRIHRLAVVEIDHEVDFYEDRQPGLGAELESEIDAVFSLILRYPALAPSVRGCRRGRHAQGRSKVVSAAVAFASRRQPARPHRVA